MVFPMWHHAIMALDAFLSMCMHSMQDKWQCQVTHDFFGSVVGSNQEPASHWQEPASHWPSHTMWLTVSWSQASSCL